MGTVQSNSTPSCPDTDNITLNSNQSECSLEFEPSQSYVAAYAINEQTHPFWDEKSLGDSVMKDARTVKSALVRSGAVLENNARILSVSGTGECTFEGIESTLKQQARQVGENGTFFFFFAGHGCKFADEKSGLAPSDFDGTYEKGITGEMLTQWLEDAPCKAKYIVLILDCSYSGWISDAVKSVKNDNRRLFVLASGTGDDASLAVTTLGNSIFSYFFVYAIDNVEFSAGKLSLRAIYDTLKNPCCYLSSLLLKKVEHNKLVRSTNTPQLVQKQEKDKDNKVVPNTSRPKLAQTRGYVVPRQVTQIQRMYDDSKPMQGLHDECYTYFDDAEETLWKLNKDGILDLPNVLKTVMCCMMYSVAFIQRHCEEESAHRNLIITAYVKVISAIATVRSDVEFPEADCVLGLEYYKAALDKKHKPDVDDVIVQLQDRRQDFRLEKRIPLQLPPS